MSDVQLGTISANVALNLDQLTSGVAEVKSQLQKLAADMKTQLGGIGSAAQGLGTSFGSVTQSIEQTAKSLRGLSEAGKQAQGSSDSVVGSLMKFGAVNAVLGETRKAVEGIVEASKEYALQTARVSRVSEESTKLIGVQLREGVAKYGVSVKDAGEGMYQLGTHIKNTNDVMAAQDTLLKLVTGTQADARETARTMVQIYEQFPDAFAKGTTEAEKYRRIGELLAVTFKDASAEMGEVSNSLKYLGPIAESAKIPLQQVMGIITGLTAEGVRGRMAGTEATAFITNIVKKYNEALGGIENKGSVYHFALAKTAEGGIDLLKTLENIIRAANKLPIDKQREYMLAISGTTQSFRFLGAQGESSLRDIEQYVHRADDAMHGLTHEADKLAAKMQENIYAQFGRTIAGGLALASEALDSFLRKLNLLGGKDGYLKTVADGFSGLLGEEAKRQENSDLIAHRTLLQDAQQKQVAVSGALDFIKQNPDSGKDWRVNGKLQRFYNADDLAPLGPHAVSAAQQMGGDDGRGKLMPAQWELLQKYIAENSKTGYVSVELLKAMLEQAKSNAAHFSAIAAQSSAAASAGKTNAGAAIAAHLHDAIETPAFAQSCAYFASAVMKKAGLAVPDIGSASGLRDFLVKHGAQKVANNALQPGDYLMWQGAHYGPDDAYKKQHGYGNHAGIYEGNGQVRASSGVGSGNVKTHALYDTAHLSAYRLPDAFLGTESDDPAITDSPKTLEERQKKAEAAQRKREAAARKAQAAAEKLAREKEKLQDGLNDFTGELYKTTHSDVEGQIFDANKQAKEDEENPLIGKAKAQQRYAATVKKILGDTINSLQESARDFQKRFYALTHDEYDVRRDDAKAQYDEDRKNPLIGQQKALDAYIQSASQINKERNSDTLAKTVEKAKSDFQAQAERVRKWVADINDTYNNQTVPQKALQKEADGAGQNEYTKARSAAQDDYEKNKWIDEANATKVYEAALDAVAAKEYEDYQAKRKQSEQATAEQVEEFAKTRQGEYETNQISYSDYRDYLTTRLALTRQYSAEWAQIQAEIFRLDREHMKDSLSGFQGIMNTMKQHATDILGNGIFEAMSSKSKHAFADMLKSFEDMVKQMLAKAIALGIINLLTGGAGGFLGSAGKGGKGGGGFLSAFGFDDAGNDASARRWGSDFAQNFSSGVSDSQRFSNPKSAGGKSIQAPVTVNMHGTTIREEADIDRIGDAIAWHTQQRLRVVT